MGNKQNKKKENTKEKKNNQEKENIQKKEYYNEFYKEMEENCSNIIKEMNLTFDSEKIKKNLSKYKLNEEFIILIESGSLAPPHKMHLGLMEISKKYIEEHYKTKKVIGGFLVPSSDDYVKHKLKKDFIPLEHRVKMTKLMIKDSDWLECLDWGFAVGDEIKICLQIMINKLFPKYNIKCILVFGIDFYLRGGMVLFDTCVCVFRPGYDVEKVKEMYPENLIFVEGKDEDISSTLIRKAIREKDEKIINELTSKEIVDYIKNNDIFNKAIDNNAQ